jgi:phosphatidylglycerophosphate synthase
MAEEPSFSIAVLEQLRAAHYRPSAWLHMLSASWTQARTTATAYPTLVSDWRRLTGTLGAATLLYAVYTAKRLGRSASCKTAIPLTLATLALSGDQYVHLGLHRQETGELQPHLGPAMMLTALRSWVGIGVGSRWLAGMPLTNDEALVALLAMLASDMGDGWLARRCHRTSGLGQYLDGEADMLSWTALTLTQVQKGLVPAWFLVVHGLRWGLPLALGFRRTFATARPMMLNHSRMGRVAGASQTLLATSAIASSLRSARQRPLDSLSVGRTANQLEARWWELIHKSLLVFSCVSLGLTALQHVASILRS